MPSSKGKPTDPKLREKVKNEVQAETGGGWSAWQAAKMAKKYEEKGGGYENDPSAPNKAKKGTPEPKEGNEGHQAGGAAQTAKREKKAAEEQEGSKKKTSKAGGESKSSGAAANGKKTTSSTTKKATQKKEPAKGSRTQPKRGVKK